MMLYPKRIEGNRLSTMTYGEFIHAIPEYMPILQEHALDNALKLSLQPGLLVELGVFEGRTITKICNAHPTSTVYGFDSFVGAPDAWDRPDQYGYEKGAFSMSGVLPVVPGNANLIPGWFADTLPVFAYDHRDEKISFLHVDCDIYSSTKCALDTLGPLLQNGTVIVFDELLNYPRYERHELLALYEFLTSGVWDLEFIGKWGEVVLNPLEDNGGHLQGVACRLHKAGATPKIAFITAVYGSYEKTCKPFVPPSIPADFICFTNQPELIPNGWTLDLTPYHLMEPKPACWNEEFYNTKNKHTFCVAKYYKQAFYLIPRLKQYDVVIWLDGTIQITNADAARIVAEAVFTQSPVTCFMHEYRINLSDSLLGECEASNFERYTSTWTMNQEQPVQRIMEQYHTYMAEGYTQNFFEGGPSMWITCLVGFNMRHPKTQEFLQLWYQQTLQHSTQDQVGFPYVCWRTNIKPYTLPGNNAHYDTFLYSKLSHGK